MIHSHNYTTGNRTAATEPSAPEKSVNNNNIQRKKVAHVSSQCTGCLSDANCSSYTASRNRAESVPPSASVGSHVGPLCDHKCTFGRGLSRDLANHVGTSLNLAHVGTYLHLPIFTSLRVLSTTYWLETL